MCRDKEGSATESYPRPLLDCWRWCLAIGSFGKRYGSRFVYRHKSGLHARNGAGNAEIEIGYHKMWHPISVWSAKLAFQRYKAGAVSGAGFFLWVPWRKSFAEFLGTFFAQVVRKFKILTGCEKKWWSTLKKWKGTKSCWKRYQVAVVFFV